MMALTLTERQRGRLLAAVEQQVEACLAAELERALFALVATELVFEFGGWVLRVFLEHRERRISLEESATFCQVLRPLLEELPEVAGLNVQLEVGSPGLFRVLSTAREAAFYRGWPVFGIETPKAGELWDPRACEPRFSGVLKDWDVVTGRLSLVEGRARLPLKVLAERPVSAEILLSEYPQTSVALAPVIEWPSEADEADDEDALLLLPLTEDDLLVVEDSDDD